MYFLYLFSSTKNVSFYLDLIEAKKSYDADSEDESMINKLTLSLEN